MHGFEDIIAKTPTMDIHCPSLAHWLELCNRADVLHVPAEKVVDVPKALIKRIDEMGEHFRSFGEQIEAAKEEWYMLRWDCCAPMGVKGRLANGKSEWSPDVLNLHVVEIRTFDVLMQHPGDMVPVWKRPWMEAQVLDGYPVEYRVYVEDSQIIGVSNYYPQRPLPDNEKTRDQIRRCRSLTESLIRALPEGAEMVGTDGWVLDGISFTADFMMVEAEPSAWTIDRDITKIPLFLEGGPPHRPAMGAHPCCFEPGEIDGIALSNRNDT